MIGMPLWNPDLLRFSHFTILHQLMRLCNIDKYDRIIVNELGRMWVEPVMAYLRYIPVFAPRGHKKHGQNSQSMAGN
jgi:hypothetical protein